MVRISDGESIAPHPDLNPRQYQRQSQVSCLRFSILGAGWQSPQRVHKRPSSRMGTGARQIKGMAASCC